MSSFEIIEPATGEPLASIAQGTADDVDRAAREAAHAFAPWRALNPRSGDDPRDRH